MQCTCSVRACFARCSSSVFPREKAKEKVAQSTSTCTCTVGPLKYIATYLTFEGTLKYVRTKVLSKVLSYFVFRASGENSVHNFIYIIKGGELRVAEATT